MKRILLAVIAALYTFTAQAQETNLKISGYIESYYSYDFNKPENHLKPQFLYNFNRHNEVNLNLGIIKATYSTENVHGNLGLMVGTYPQYNMAAEPDLLRNIYEANAGIKLSKSSNLWLDAGIFASHIGFEGAIGKDNWTLTRSILAENSPYYEAGAKITYTSTDNTLVLSGLYLNGWQRIQRVEGNSTPAFGTQVIYKPSDQVTLNSSTFIGNDKPDNVRLNRYFHNFYGVFQLDPQFGLILGFDMGTEQKAKGSDQYNTWYSPVAIIRYQPSAKISLAGRAEYYSDKNGVIISSGTPNGFKTWGYSANIDYSPYPNVVLRLEGRVLDSKDLIFMREENPVNHNASISTSIALSF
ncbi:MAG: porin [Daejeonella sp.]